MVSINGFTVDGDFENSGLRSESPPSINHEIRNVIKMLFKNSVALLKSSLPLEGNGGVSENGSEDD